MGFRLPSKLLNQAPRNYGRADRIYPVSQQVDHYVARANAQYLEAIAVDGTEAVIWHRSQTGRRCSCQVAGSLNYKSVQPNSNVQEKQANRENSLPSIKVRGMQDWMIQRADNATQSHMGIKIGELPPDEQGNDGPQENQVFEPDMSDVDAFLSNPDSSVLFGGETNPCGICFKTGYVNGYSLLQGIRDVLDTTHPGLTDMVADIVDSDKPFSFEFASTQQSFVSWIVSIPAYFEKCLTVVVRNNGKSATGCKVVYKIAGSGNSFVDLTPLALLSLKNTTLDIRVVPSETDGTICKFTHVELIYQTTPWWKIQIPPMSESTNFTIFDAVLNSQFVCPPTIPHLGKEDIIFENKYNTLWKVTDVTDFKTTKQQVCGWSVSVRNVQAYEQISLLNLIKSPQFELSYKNLEAIQGQFLNTKDGL